MTTLLETYEAVSTFLSTGGQVLSIIFVVTLLMWTLIIERFWFLRRVYPGQEESVLGRWRTRDDKRSWYAAQIRRQLVSELSVKLNTSLPMIRTLVGLCSLLGLLGTVTGMIEVFDVMAAAGNSNPRAMAAGVSKATIPTMAGMVAALSGLYFATQLDRTATHRAHQLEERLSEA